MRIIKTYTNGRFYDTLDRQYIRKDQLVALIHEKEPIKIIMHNTGSDVTQSVLKKMTAVATPKDPSMLNIDNLRKWLSDQVDRRIEKTVQLINLPSKSQVTRLRADIETLTKKVDGLQKRLTRTKSPGKPSPINPKEKAGVQA
jgi:hypothetical protein